MTYRPRLYLITPPRIDDVGRFADQFEAALAGGDVASLQIRCKSIHGIDVEMTRAVARQVLPIAQDQDVAVFINDSAELALELDADGVHLGQGDGEIKAARKLLGEDRIIGVTCHNSRHLAMVAGEAGADYVAFGAFYPTSTKVTEYVAELDLLNWWQALMELPCVAIGGITPENAAPLVEAGADFLAVSGAVWGHGEGPKQAVEAFNAVIDRCHLDNRSAPDPSRSS